MKLLLGVYPVNQGEIYLHTKGGKIPVADFTRSLFAYVPQGNMLFSGTVKDNVTFINGNATEQEIETALKISGADAFVNALPDKLNTLVGENGMGLSEGQVQRIAIARAILSKAPILLLDEATGSLDEATERQVIQNILALKDKTVILISHRHSAATMCEKIVCVEEKKFN
jgi:ATP-binding cassette subfamily B protein